MNPLKTLFFGAGNRIGRRLVILMIAFSSVITLSISVVDLVSEYRSLRSDLDRNLDELGIYMPSLSDSVWDFDDKQIQLSLDALAMLSHVDRVSVTTINDRKVWTAGTPPSSKSVSRTYPLRHTALGKEMQIGTLEVVAGLNAIHRQVFDRALMIVLSNGLKTFLVALFMTFLIRQLITNRLENLAQRLGTMVPRLPQLPRVARQAEAPIPAGRDELGAVEWTLDQAANSLRVVIGALQDVNAELNARIAEQEALLHNALVGILLVRHGRIVYCNPRFEEISGFARGDLIGQSTRVLYRSDIDYATYRQHASDLVAAGENFHGIFLMARSGGNAYWAEISGRAIDRADPEAGAIWVFNDVTKRKEAEDEIEFIAFHDALTGLPNRLLFEDRFDQACAHAERERCKVALALIDLDNFKTVNDALGHAAGDKLLRQMATRLKECVREVDTVSRQGGDEFLILLPGLAEPDAIAPLLCKISERIGEPCLVDGHEFTITASIGVAIFPDDGCDVETLMKKADMAMYRAKSAGRNAYRFFDEQMQIEAVEQLGLRNGLRHALKRDELLLHYQPQFDLASGALVGVEALLRWQHPTLGMVAPDRFIPVAEESGLIVPIGEWVLKQACRQAAAWQRAGLPELAMAVNLSAVQFRRGDVEQAVYAALRDSGLEARLLELELTESVLIEDTESVLATVKRLKLLGVKLSIDDFGTGYSSLSYLKRFQADQLKIDRSFVRDLAQNQEDAAIVRAVIQVAKGFGLTTIAEGVEDEPALELLRVFGCDQAQGYYFAKPMPPEALEEFFARIGVAPKHVHNGTWFGTS